MLLAALMFSLLFLGFPFMVIILLAVIVFVYFKIPGFDMSVLVQQVITGITPPALVCVPLFIFAASIITSGQAARRLIRMIKSYIGHIPGGLPITTNASCTLFGAVSGSTQDTVAAIGGTLRPMLLEAG
ncbi:MAG: TRAP transporter large permease subunit, partial [Spirochaetota bacterium]